MPSTEASTARDRMLTGLPVRARRIEVAGVDTYLVEGGDRDSRRPDPRPGPPAVTLRSTVIIWCSG